MLKLKKLFNLKTICLVATLVFLVTCYFAARKVMVWDIELGMTRAEVIKMLGEPDEFGVYPVPNSETWQRIVFSVSIYRRITAVYFDSEGKANLIYVDHDLFDHRFAHSRGSILPAWIQRD